ncbi:hypothetical protein QJQ45_016681 [Haematococcus lacustris]|nr:hypothetical protein QJQ45_016681 [Haematococcus lacustris]
MLPAAYQPSAPGAPPPPGASKAPHPPPPFEPTLSRPPSLAISLGRTPSPAVPCCASLPCPSPTPGSSLPPLTLPPLGTSVSPPSSSLMMSGGCLPASLPHPVGCPYDQSQLDPAHLLARTLQPVGFMHPGLASHPDLGELDLAPAGPCTSSPSSHAPACGSSPAQHSSPPAAEEMGRGKQPLRQQPPGVKQAGREGRLHPSGRCLSRCASSRLSLGSAWWQHGSRADTAAGEGRGQRCGQSSSSLLLVPSVATQLAGSGGEEEGEGEGEGSVWGDRPGARPGRRSFAHRWQSTGSSRGHSSSSGSSDSSESARTGAEPGCVMASAPAAGPPQTTLPSPTPAPASQALAASLTQPSSGGGNSGSDTHSSSIDAAGSCGSCGGGEGRVGSGTVSWEAYQQGAMSLTPSPATTTGLRLPAAATTPLTSKYTPPAATTPSPPANVEAALPPASPLLTTQPLYDCVGRGSYDLGLLMAHLPATSPVNPPASPAVFQPFLLPTLLTRTTSTAPPDSSTESVARRTTLATMGRVTIPGSVTAPPGGAARDVGDAPFAGSAFARAQALLDPALLAHVAGTSPGPPSASASWDAPDAYSPSSASGPHSLKAGGAGAAAGPPAAALDPRQPGLWPAPSLPCPSASTPWGGSQSTSQASTPCRASSLAQPQPIYIGYTCSHPGDPFTATAVAVTASGSPLLAPSCSRDWRFTAFAPLPPGPPPSSPGPLPPAAPSRAAAGGAAAGSEGGRAVPCRVRVSGPPAGIDWLLATGNDAAWQRGPPSGPPSAAGSLAAPSSSAGQPCDVTTCGAWATIRTQPSQATKSGPPPRPCCCTYLQAGRRDQWPAVPPVAPGPARLPCAQYDDTARPARARGLRERCVVRRTSAWALAVGAFIPGSPRTSMDYPAGHPTPGFGSSVSRCPPTPPDSARPALQRTSTHTRGGAGQPRGAHSLGAWHMSSSPWAADRVSVELDRSSSGSKPDSAGGSVGSSGVAVGGGRGGASREAGGRAAGPAPPSVSRTAPVTIPIA